MTISIKKNSKISTSNQYIATFKTLGSSKVFAPMVSAVSTITSTGNI
jgi:hypothetical protein